MTTETPQASDVADVAGAETLTITDNRTGKTYEVPIEDETIRATELRKIKVNEDDFGLMTYDPAFMNTASCRSAITYIDGDKGILEYRGYPIEQLAENSSYLEVAYLLVHGELPNQAKLDKWTEEITMHTFVHENIKEFMQGFRYDAHPMGMLLASTGALSTFYPEANQIKDTELRYMQVIRLIAKMPTLAAFSYRHNKGMPYVYPDNDLSYAGNFLGMIYKMSELKYEPDPRLERDLLELHRDVEQRVAPGHLEHVLGRLLDDLRPRVEVLVHPVAEPHQPLVAVLHALDEVGNVVHAPDPPEHAQDCFVGTAVERPVERCDSRRYGRVGIDLRGADAPDGARRAVLLVIGVQDEEDVERAFEPGVGAVLQLGHLVDHPE